MSPLAAHDHLSTLVIAAVLAAAFMHAAWNTLAKWRSAQSGDAVMVGIAAAIPAIVVAPWVGWPARDCWPQLVATAIIHFFYFRILAAAYARGALSVAYPLMRGVPPLLSGLGATVVFNEVLSPAAWLAICALLAGVLLLGWDGFRKGSIDKATARWVTIQIGIIVAYTLVDASGARASTSAFNYVVWMFILTSAALIVPARSSVTRLLREGPRSVLLAVIAGGLTFGSYGVALWAMTAAPVALVAALRETSILFGAGLGAWLLKERFGAHRWAAVALISLGVLGMRLA